MDPHWFRSRISMRIRIQGAKPMRIHATLDTVQTLKSQKVKFSIKNVLKVCKNLKKHTYEGTKAILKGGNQVWVNFDAPGFGSAFPIRIRIQDRQINRYGSMRIRKRIQDTYMFCCWFQNFWTGLIGGMKDGIEGCAHLLQHGDVLLLKALLHSHW